MMASSARRLLLLAVVVLCVASAAAQATTQHWHKSKGDWGKGKKAGCTFKHIELSLPFTPIAADRIFPATPDIKEAAIATPIVRSFYLRPEGQPEGPNIATATVNAILMEPETVDNIRIANAAVNAKFEGGAYSGWVTGSGHLIYDFSKDTPAVSTDYSITGGSGDFLGAVGTLTSTIIGTQGALVLKLDVPSKSCFYN